MEVVGVAGNVSRQRCWNEVKTVLTQKTQMRQDCDDGHHGVEGPGHPWLPPVVQHEAVWLLQGIH